MRRSFSLRRLPAKRVWERQKEEGCRVLCALAELEIESVSLRAARKKSPGLDA